MLTGMKLTSIDDAKKAALQLLNYGPSIAIVTMGKQGAVVASKSGNEPVHVKAPVVKPVDTTVEFFSESLLLFMDAICRALAIASLDLWLFYWCISLTWISSSKFAEQSPSLRSAFRRTAHKLLIRSLQILIRHCCHRFLVHVMALFTRTS